MGLKRIQPTGYHRIVAGRKAGFAVLFGLYAIVGVLSPVVGPGWLVVYVIGGVVAPAFVAVAAAYIWGHMVMFSPLVVTGSSNERRYVCQPCTGDHLGEACDVVRPVLGKDHVDWNVLEQWRLRNPQGFMELVNEQGVLVACFVVLGLEQTFFRQFISGTVMEGDIVGQTVLPIREAKKEKDIYISGVMVRDPKSPAGDRRTVVMLWCMTKYIRHHYGIHRDLYAIAVNRDSKRLLEHLGFQVVTPGNRRRDVHDFYCLVTDDATFRKMEETTGDFSLCCSIKYRRK